MKLLLQYLVGVKILSKGIVFVFQNRLWYYFLVPLILNLLLWIIGVGSAYELVDTVTSFVISYFSFLNQLPNWLQLIVEFGLNLIYILLFLLFFLVLIYLGGFVVLIVLSPFLSAMAAHVYKLSLGYAVPFSFTGLAGDVLRGIVISMRNMFFQLLFNLLFLLMMLIPMAGWLTPLALFFNSAYYYGFSFLDFGLEQHQISYRKAILFVQFNRGLALGIGSVFAFCLAIPYIGIFLAGFASIFLTVGAVLEVNQLIAKR